MMLLYAKIEPSSGGATAPFRVTQISQWEADALVWAAQSMLDPQRRDVLMVYFPECGHQDALDFIAWIRHRPILIEVVTVLQEDGILWKMWSVENGATPLNTPFNTDDEKFLKSLKVKWENETKDQSGLHLVQGEDRSQSDPSLGSDR